MEIMFQLTTENSALVQWNSVLAPARVPVLAVIVSQKHSSPRQQKKNDVECDLQAKFYKTQSIQQYQTPYDWQLPLNRHPYLDSKELAVLLAEALEAYRVAPLPHHLVRQLQ